MRISLQDNHFGDPQGGKRQLISDFKPENPESLFELLSK